MQARPQISRWISTGSFEKNRKEDKVDASAAVRVLEPATSACVLSALGFDQDGRRDRYLSVSGPGSLYILRLPSIFDFCLCKSSQGGYKKHQHIY